MDSELDVAHCFSTLLSGPDLGARICTRSCTQVDHFAPAPDQETTARKVWQSIFLLSRGFWDFAAARTQALDRRQSPAIKQAIKRPPLRES